MIGSDSTTSSNTTNINLEDILKAKELLEKVPKCPFVDLAGKDFDVDRGDIIIFPKSYEEVITTQYKGDAKFFPIIPVPSYVKFSAQTKDTIVVKGVYPKVADLVMKPIEFPGHIHTSPWRAFEHIVHSWGYNYKDYSNYYWNTYKGQRVTRTSTEPYIFTASWKEGLRMQECHSYEEAKKIIDVALFFSHQIGGVEL